MQTARQPAQRVVFHVDIDAFYASVEQRDNPHLAGKPVIVGALPGHRGVVSACSYEARRYGVHSAMPISQAQQRCPQGVFLPVRMERYGEVSRSVMALLREYSPEFHQISVDEAYLDLTGTERLLGPPVEVGRGMKAAVREKEGLTLSVGIAPNAYLAKLASEAGKPDGLVQIRPGEETAFLDRLELEDLWGIGAKTLELLHELNITSIPRLRSFPLDLLTSMLGKATARFLYSAAQGRDPGVLRTETKSHSVSNETTFETDRRDPAAVHQALLELSQHVMGRMLEAGLRSKTAFLKLRFHDFTTCTARRTVKHWITSSEELYGLALDLLGKRWDTHTPVRLVGVGFSNVVRETEDEQLELFGDEDDRRRKVEEAVVDLRRKLTGIKLTRASLLRPGEAGGRRRAERPGKGDAPDSLGR